jgi:hypothetical protein
VLIRLSAHHSRRNMNGIDEMIAIQGLPDDLIFRFHEGKRYLKGPWEIDPEKNIPKHIREHCETFDIAVDLPKERNEMTGTLQMVTDTVQAIGFRIALDNNPGKELWARIERLIEGHTPNDKKIPRPAIVAPNQKEDFFLSAEDIPVVDLRPKMTETVTVVTTPSPIVQMKVEGPSSFSCLVCHKSFSEKRGLWMHGRKMRHAVDQPVAVGG